MTNLLRPLLFSLCCALFFLQVSCSKSESVTQTNENTPPENTASENKVEQATIAQKETEQTENKTVSQEKPLLPVIKFGGGSSMPSPGGSSKQGSTVSVQKENSAADAEAIISQLKELQILLGTWRGITKKNFEGSNLLDETKWVWDFQTNTLQPALIATSDKSPYYRDIRLTYLLDKKKYQLTTKNADKKTSTFLGKFTVPIEDAVDDDGKTQRTYKLEFTQIDAKDRKVSQFVFNQKNNNRYLLEYYQQRGAANRFFRMDTVSTQREGTSFALIDEGYGEKTCIISGGLGTITVSHAGKTYYVCCTGCKAAFEEDPTKWITRAEKQKMK